MAVPIFVVDAFAEHPFGGNPAAVCVLRWQEDPVWMQRVAAEMRHSETAFLLPSATGYSLRWFTPEVEVDLCGHATLSAAHVLWNHLDVPLDHEIVFETRSGRLVAWRDGVRIVLDFPAAGPRPVTKPAVATLFPGCLYCGQNDTDLLIEIETEEAVRTWHPEFEAIVALAPRGVILTARSDDARFDFVSRFFAPNAGVPEDPVTGSAHCCLGPYWSLKLGKRAVTGFQASSRGGAVEVEMADDRVRLKGQAVTVLEGTLLV
jgi:PhzF family phenazine biosynthesis protein